jgi:hypothetical protein
MRSSRWKLRLKAWLGTPDWRSELIEAYQRGDWDSFAFALRHSPRLLNDREQIDHQPPLNLAIESRRLDLVKTLVEAGADLSRTSTHAVPAANRWPVNSVPEASGRAMLCVGAELPFRLFVQGNCLVIARAIDAEDIHDYLWSVVPQGVRYEAMCAALMLADEASLERIDVSAVVNDLPRAEMSLAPPPPIAAIMGGCRPEVFARIWAACSQELREQHYTESPGYGHDRDPVYSGPASYWAELAHRPELLETIMTPERSA